MDSTPSIGGTAGKFALRIDSDDRLRVINAQTDERYARPDEGEIHRQAREQAERRQREEAAARQRVEKQLEVMRAELEELRRKHPGS